MKYGPSIRARCVAALLLLCMGAPAAWAACSVAQLELPVRIVNHRPVAMLTLNGRELPMLLDSGAFFSMLQLSTATQLGLKQENLPNGMRIEGHTGKVEARLTRVDRVGFGGTELRNVEFIVGGNELDSGIAGVLGRNFLSIADTEYDLAHGMVRLTFPKGDCDKVNFAHWAGDAPVIVTELDGHRSDGHTGIRVPVQINERRMRALMDTGAPRTVLTLRAARRAGLKDEDLQEAGRTGGAGQARARSWTALLASFQLGGEKIANNRFAVDEVRSDDYDMLIGLDYFLSHRIYVSRLQRKVYATWNGGAVFARGAEVGDYDASQAARPAEIAPDDAEALARRGEAFAARGEFKQALADLDRACAAAPQSAPNFLARARVQLALKQPALALRDLDEALRLDPGLHEARAIRASMRAGLRERDAALQDLATLDAALPPSAHLRERMAQVYLSLDLLPEALRQWNLWVPTHRSDARLAEVLNNRCWLRVRLNAELGQALEDCEEAIDLDGRVAAHRDSLGWVQLRLDKPAAAIKAFDAALAIKPLPFSLYGRGLAWQRRGDAESGRRDLAAARQLQPGIDAAVAKEGLPVAGDALPAAAPAASAP